MSQPKVLIITQRDRPDQFGRQPGYVPFLEAEDVLAECSDADFFTISESLHDRSVRLRRLMTNLSRSFGIEQTRPRNRTPSLLDLPEQAGGFAPETQHRHYDVAVFVAFTPWDIPLLQPALQERSADTVIMWVPELWLSLFNNRKLAHEPFAAVDHIFVGMAAATNKLREITDIPVHYLPMAVDVERFTGLHRPDSRSLEVMAIGRRDEKLHETLVEWARVRGRMYLYDTITGTRVTDPQAHRENLAETYRRASVAITHYAKFDQPSVTGDEREIPGRLWEAMAAGTLMTGNPPSVSLQTGTVGEPIVLPLPENPDSALLQIERLIEADTTDKRQYLMRMAARHHDWAHRWAAAFIAAGLPVPVGIRARIDGLAHLAAQ